MTYVGSAGGARDNSTSLRFSYGAEAHVDCYCRVVGERQTAELYHYTSNYNAHEDTYIRQRQTTQEP